MKTTQTNRRLTKEQRALRERNQREMDRLSKPEKKK